MESGENLGKCDALKPVGLGSLAAVNKNKLVIIASGKSAARVRLRGYFSKQVYKQVYENGNIALTC